MKPTTVIIVVLALLSAGLTTGIVRAVKRNQELVSRLADTAPPAAPAPDVARLRQALEDQEAVNAVLRDELVTLRQGTATTNRPATSVNARLTNPGRDNRGTAGSAWLDRLKQEDPARYKQIVEQREQRRKATDQWFADTINQLDQRAQTAPTETEATLATQIADTLAKLNDLRQQWDAIRSLPEAERNLQMQQLIAQTRDATQALRDLSEQDRALQLQNYARSLGVTDENGVQSFVAGIASIYSNTSYRVMTGGGSRGGPAPNAGTATTSTGNAPPTPRP